MSVFVVTYGVDYEGEQVLCVAASLDDAKHWAEANTTGDSMVITECDPTAIHRWERRVERTYNPRAEKLIGEWEQLDTRL